MGNWDKKAAVGLISVCELEAHNVRIYANRIAISRKDGNRMGWEELQHVKQTVWGDEIAIEVYPAEADVVNLRHTRHLWKSQRLTDAVVQDCRHPEFDN